MLNTLLSILLLPDKKRSSAEKYMSEIDVVHAAGSTSSMLEGVLDINSPTKIMIFIRLYDMIRLVLMIPLNLLL